VVVGRAHCDRGGTRGKVAVVYFSVRCGGVGGNQEPYWEPLTQFHSLLATQRSEKKWPGVVIKRVELKLTGDTSPAIVALRA
jgi:hypothetical protein